MSHHTSISIPRRVVIMGASSGIGWELAHLYIERGYRLGLAARRLDRLDSLRAMAPERVEISGIDVTDEAAGEHLGQLIERLGGLDLYIHSSGIGWQNAALDPELELRTTAVNVLGFTRCLDFVFGYFARLGRGHIVAISSIAGTRGLGAAAAYSASKAYQASYLQALRQLCRVRSLEGLTITDIRPGFVDTPLLTGGRYPMMLSPQSVARQIASAVDRGRSVRIIDWRYRLLVGLWRLIPRQVWERLPLG